MRTPSRGGRVLDPSDEGQTGLGLALVKAIFERHGDSVSAATRPKGAVAFAVRLPVVWRSR